ncbi:MAG TPA: helix-turn-helix domain-containing protein [Nitrososphaera sp.]|nr:helix-turn-helix domain-containing protein [Nitrososphaera sp.]
MVTDNSQNNIDPKYWYSAAEAAQHLGIKEQTVTDYCRDGRFKKAKKQGPKRRWHVQGSEIVRKRKEWGLD